MRWISFGTVTMISLLAITDADAASPRPERVGNMKRIVVPEKGEPQTIIGINGSANAPARPRARGQAAKAPQLSNPTPSNGVPVRTIVDPALRRGGPGIIP